MATSAGTVSVTNGSQIVTGTLTVFVAAQGDQFILRGLTAVVDQVVSATQLRLKKPWAGPTIASAEDWDLSLTGPYWNSTVSTNKRLADLIRQFEIGPVKWDKAGTLAQRDGYNNQAEGFTYLAVEPMPFRLYTKLSSVNAASSWSNGQILGTLTADYPLTADAVGLGKVSNLTDAERIAAGRPIGDALAGKASLTEQGKVLATQIDFTKGGDWTVDLALPANLTIAAEVKARGVIPAARLGITGGSADQTAKWQAAINDALKSYKQPVELNAGQSHRIGQRLAFPQGSGIVNPGGASVVGDCADFNNISRDLGPRYGSNAVMLYVDHAKGVRFEGLKLVLQAGSAATFKDRYVQGIVAMVSDDLKLIDVDISGFNAGNMVNIQSSKGVVLTRPYLHHGIVHTDNTNRAQTQLTGISIDGDEALDNGLKVGSTVRIEYPRITDLRATAQVLAATTEQTDGINVAGIYADVRVFHPWIENVNEAIDCFGRLEMRGGRLVNAGNFAVKLVHGPQDCYIDGFQARNIGLAGVIIQSSLSEDRAIRNNYIRGSLRNIGIIAVPEITVNGVTAPALNARPNPDAPYEVLILDQGGAYPVENCYVEVNIEQSTQSVSPVRTGTTGLNNTVVYSNNDGSTDAKRPEMVGPSTVRRSDKSTNVIAYATNPQALPASTAVVNYGTKVVDRLGEWNGSEFAPKLPGTYSVRASTRFPGQNGDTLLLSIRKNGTLRKSDSRAYGPDQLAADVSHTVPMVLGDKLDIVSLLNRAQSNTAGEQYSVITISRVPD